MVGGGKSRQSPWGHTELSVSVHLSCWITEQCKWDGLVCMLWPLTVTCTRQIQGLEDKEAGFCFSWVLGTLRELYSLAQYIIHIAICSLSLWSVGMLPGLTAFSSSSPCRFFFLYAGLKITKGAQSFYLFPSQLGLGVRVFSTALLSHHWND